MRACAGVATYNLAPTPKGARRLREGIDMQIENKAESKDHQMQNNIMETENPAPAVSNGNLDHSGDAPRGRPFAKGNPGRPPGSKNKRTLLAAVLLEDEAEELPRAAIAMAKGGDTVIMKLLLDRVLPKDWPIQVELPLLN